VSGLRRAARDRALSDERAAQAIGDYADLPLTRHGHAGLMTRMFDLRANFSAYDATYVALAEQLGAELLTTDDRLARAAREQTGIPVIS